MDGPRGANYITLTCVRRCVQHFNVEHKYAAAMRQVKKTRRTASSRAPMSMSALQRTDRIGNICGRSHNDGGLREILHGCSVSDNRRTSSCIVARSASVRQTRLQKLDEGSRHLRGFQ